MIHEQNQSYRKSAYYSEEHPSPGYHINDGDGPADAENS